MVAVRDIGEIAALAFERTEAAAGCGGVGGGRRDHAEAASLLSTKMGRPVKFVDVPDDEACRTMGLK